MANANQVVPCGLADNEPPGTVCLQVNCTKCGCGGMVNIHPDRVEFQTAALDDQVASGRMVEGSPEWIAATCDHVFAGDITSARTAAGDLVIYGDSMLHTIVKDAAGERAAVALTHRHPVQPRFPIPPAARPPVICPPAANAEEIEAARGIALEFEATCAAIRRLFARRITNAERVRWEAIEALGFYRPEPTRPPDPADQIIPCDLPPTVDSGTIRPAEPPGHTIGDDIDDVGGDPYTGPAPPVICPPATNGDDVG